MFHQKALSNNHLHLIRLFLSTLGIKPAPCLKVTLADYCHVIVTVLPNPIHLIWIKITVSRMTDRASNLD